MKAYHVVWAFCWDDEFREAVSGVRCLMFLLWCWGVVVGVAVGLGGVELRKSMLETWSPMPRVLQYSSRVYARKSTIHNSSSVRLTLPVQQQRSNTAPFLARLPGNHFIFTIDLHPTYGYEPNVIKNSAGSTSTSLRGWQA